MTDSISGEGQEEAGQVAAGNPTAPETEPTMPAPQGGQVAPSAEPGTEVAPEEGADENPEAAPEAAPEAEAEASAE